MCTNKRWVVNKYTGEHILAKCGHCKACLQEKANRMTQKIKDNHRVGYLECFVTLTYDRSSAPYILESDLLALKEHDEYRKIQVHREFKYFRKRGEIIARRIYKNVDLGVVELSNSASLPFYKDIDGKLRKYYHHLSHRRGKIGVVWYDDVRNFEKRLRQNLHRVFNYHGKIKLYKCAEYGETTSRPHFHLLIQVEASATGILRRAVYASWPFANLSKMPKSFQVARNAASYCASYVNCCNTIHEFFQANFKPKHSHSKYFGQSPECFSLSSILEKTDAGDLRVARAKFKDGVQVCVNLPIPKYVINRYFPLFKGYSRLVSSPLVWLRSGCRGSDGKFHLDFSQYALDGIDIDRDIDIPKIDTRLTHACEYYMNETGKNQFDYLIDFQRVWNCFRSTCFRHYWSDEDIPIYEHFDNLSEFIGHDTGHEYDYIVLSALTLNPNGFPHEVNRTVSLTELFDKKDKTRKVFNRVQNKFQQKKIHRIGLF